MIDATLNTRVREAIRMMEENLTTSIMRSDGGTVRRVYLLLTNGVEYKLAPMPKRLVDPRKEVVTSKMIEKRFGLKV